MSAEGTGAGLHPIGLDGAKMCRPIFLCRGRRVSYRASDGKKEEGLQRQSSESVCVQGWTREERAADRPVLTSLAGVKPSGASAS
jgi:hypothetical protein